jgi:tetratricopeptide (TPR) repeat protein
MAHTTVPGMPPTPRSHEPYLQAYAYRRAQGDQQLALQALIGDLSRASELDWLECGRHLMLQGDVDAALAVFAQGTAAHPDSGEMRLALAGVYRHGERQADAEDQLRKLLARHPDHVAATFLLVRILKEQGRLQAAASAMRRLFEHGRYDTVTVIQAVEILDDYGQQQDAAAICEAEIAAGSTDPRIYAYAGMLGIQLGHFELVRERYDFALAHDPQAVEWNIPIGLSSLQRYKDGNHPDFRLFQDVLQRTDLSDKARTLTLFALGKAYDDIADYAQAAHYLRQANARAHANSTWSRKNWRRSIEARIATRPSSFNLAPPTDWTPVFIVGVPRSGTTLLAELLARHPNICNRGELGWLSTIARQLTQNDAKEPSAFEQAAATYAAQLRQDDSDAHWFVDKQPLNLLHVDLIMTLWPNARIIHCQRSPRDTALSLWSQSFHDSTHDYAYDFADIAAVTQGCERLMAHWRDRYTASIHVVRYEELANEPDKCIRDLTGWLELPGHDLLGSPSSGTAISTASTWQARQPVYARSVERWRSYAPYIPELLRFPER